MQRLRSKQSSILKGFFIILTICLWSFSSPLNATTIISGTEIIQLSQIDPAAATAELARQAQIPTQKASTLIKTLREGSNISSADAIKFVEGVIDQQTGLSQDINEVINIAQGLQDGIFTEKEITAFVDNVIDGVISTNLSKALIDAKNLGGRYISEAAEQIASLTNLSLQDAEKFVDSISQNVNLGLDSISELAGSVIESDILNAANIDDLVDMVDGFEDLIPAGVIGEYVDNAKNAITNIVDMVADGTIPVDIGKALALSDLDLGNISAAELLGNIDVSQALQDALGDISLTGSSGADFLAGVLRAGLNPNALQSIATQASIEQLITSLPAGLQQSIINAVGGDIGQIAQQVISLLTGQCGAVCESCAECAPRIQGNHWSIRAHITAEFEQHRGWFVTTYFLQTILPAMMTMTTELTTNMIQQVQIIGSFFDAKHQLETQRLMQQMTAQAHKDYHPSEGLCEIGTNIRSLAASQRKADLSHVAFASRMMQRQLSSADGVSTGGALSDKESRLNQFITTFCDPENGGTDSKNQGQGLNRLCQNAGKKKERYNIDINYTHNIENKLTLEVDFTKNESDKKTDDEENVFALSANLFAHQVLPTITDDLLADGNNRPRKAIEKYLDIRALAAKRSVAQNSFASITAMKSEGDTETAPFLKSIIAELGINPNEIDDFIGEKPSYFAQMEVMTKILYQNPTFYSNLYDKPVNVERKGAALQAIGLMQDRDTYKSLLRSEAVLAVLLETLLQQEHGRVSAGLNNASKEGERH